MAKKLDLAHITEQLRPLAVSIDQLNTDPANARRHPEKNLAATEASLQLYGQRKPLVVRRQGMIVEAGNGTLEAAKRLGWTHVAVVLVDDDLVTATGYAISDNRTGELAVWDEATLGKLLGELKAEDVMLGPLGWTDADLDKILGAVPAFTAQPPESQPNLAKLEPRPCPHCGKDTRVAP